MYISISGGWLSHNLSQLFYQQDRDYSGKEYAEGANKRKNTRLGYPRREVRTMPAGTSPYVHDCFLSTCVLLPCVGWKNGIFTGLEDGQAVCLRKSNATDQLNRQRGVKRLNATYRESRRQELTVFCS